MKEKIIETRELPCAVDDKGVNRLALLAAEIAGRLISLQIRKKAEAKLIASEIAEAEEALHNIHGSIRDRREIRNVDCEIVFDFKKGKATVYRMDSGEEVEVREITEEERQLELEGTKGAGGRKKS